jgi:protein involved in polysaccharide export with SLBB domain
MNQSALKILIIAMFCAVAFTLESYAQTTTPDSGKNFPYSQNPKKRSRPSQDQPEAVSNPDSMMVITPAANNNRVAAGEGNSGSRSSAAKIAAVTRTHTAAAKNAGKAATDLYRIGAGDMLDIRLLNAESKDSTLFTVAGDGSIDYPLAGGSVQVAGMTNDELEEILADRVKLYENPDFAVTVRNYSSHMVNVGGQVDKPGSKAIRKDAVYLADVLKEASPRDGANKAVVTRANGEKVSVDLEGNAVNETLIYPNDDIKLFSDPKFYYISGVQSPGEKAFRAGITLTQAIVSCGGLTRDSTAKVFIRRKNDKGLLVSANYNLKEIKDGKTPDPEIMAGDTIEIDK